jgi:hypothetical protein
MGRSLGSASVQTAGFSRSGAYRSLPFAGEVQHLCGEDSEFHGCGCRRHLSLRGLEGFPDASFENAGDCDSACGRILLIQACSACHANDIFDTKEYERLPDGKSLEARTMELDHVPDAKHFLPYVAWAELIDRRDSCVLVERLSFAPRVYGALALDEAGGCLLVPDA